MGRQSLGLSRGDPSAVAQDKQSPIRPGRSPRGLAAFNRDQLQGEADLTRQKISALGREAMI